MKNLKEKKMIQERTSAAFDQLIQNSTEFNDKQKSKMSNLHDTSILGSTLHSPSRNLSSTMNSEQKFNQTFDKSTTLHIKTLDKTKLASML